jgi:hypothetical protein
MWNMMNNIFGIRLAPFQGLGATVECQHRALPYAIAQRALPLIR